VIRDHFAARDRAEAAAFAEAAALPGGLAPHVVPPGGCNAPAEIAAMRALAPDVVLVFGTQILKDEIIEAFDGRIINLHLGLSPYYRGAGTNFWPLVNREPECVGATIHYLDRGVDSGAIIAHVRPAVRATDGPHDLGNRTIAAAADTLVAAARAHVAGRVRAVAQAGDGRLYMRKHFHADAVRRLYENFRTGMLAEYLDDRASRDARLSLVSLEEPA
jgi:methionyl-tRNA formyltransferase